MFNFHKPRVYRSADGCCICRAKSSSSRFTASRKYEKESMQCFNLHEPRNGEICNACVLLVKRYKRLPAGSKRHWGHVVDARAGPGTKSLAKQKKRDNAEAAAAAAAEVKSVSNGNNSSFLPEKFAKIFKKNRKGKITASAATTTAAAPVTSAINRPSSTSPTSEHNPSDSNESYDDDMQLTRGGTTNVVGTAAIYQTRKRTAAAALAVVTGNSVEVVKRPKLTGSKRRRQLPPKKGRRAVDNVPFFEESDLVRLEVCCGVVFQSLSLGSCCYIIDPDLYKPCEKHQRLRQQQHQLQVQHQQEMQQQQQQQKEKLVQTAANPAIPPANTTTTQVQSQAAKMGPLKKHHLFFKRQSESFPQGDVVHRISPIPLSKTEANSSHHPFSPNGGASSQKPQHSNLSLILKPTAAAAAQQSSSLPSAAVSSSTSSVSGVVSVGAASPSFSSSSNCSTSSSVATKFNDNSSDSGFDEHVLERKSVSPPTQEEWKLRGAAAGGMQLILASGLPISGQSQNLVLAGNEFTARIVQQRQQQSPPSAEAAAAAAAGVATGAVAPPLKINVVPGGGSQGNSNKMRAIFNSASSIQHENGVTTILPASSLAASNQTAAMNAIAPSTVTITPSSVVGKKVTAAGVAVANPKFILLKPAKFVGQTVPPPPPEAKIV